MSIQGSQELKLKELQEAVAGLAAAFRCRRRLQPAGGAGDRVFSLQEGVGG